MKITENVNAYLVKEKKFKTIQMMVRFREATTSKNLASRLLLSNIFCVVNAHYQSQKEFQTALAMNDGMQLVSGVSAKGNQHFLTIKSSIIDPKILGKNTLETALDFLREVIFRPYVNQDGFESLNFDLEKKELLHYLGAIKEDQAEYASLRLKNLFYSNENLKLPAVGTTELLEKVTPESLYQYYQEMLATNVIDIIILGNVEEDVFEQLFSNWHFKQRKGLESPFYQQKIRDYEEVIETKESHQSRLAMAWWQPVQYGDEDYLALQVFNALFGGQANSKLFSIVREKESLAYSIASSINSFTGQLKVSAGIDAGDNEKAQRLILNLLEEVKAGNFSQEDIAQTKALLKNDYLASLDSPAALLEEKFYQHFLPERFLTQDFWLAALEAVTKEEIQKIAEKQTLQTAYFLKGVSD